jgi:hypothetical protein
MGWLEGLLTGYANEQDSIRKDEAARAEKQAEREAGVMKLLLNSPRQDFKTMAAVGLLTNSQAQKRKGGFGGWMGEMEANPIYPKIMKYIAEGHQAYGNDAPDVPPGTAPPDATPPPTSAPKTALPQPPPAAQPPLAQTTNSPTQGAPMAAPQPVAKPTPPPPPPAPYNQVDFGAGAAPPPAPPHVSFGGYGNYPTPDAAVSFDAPPPPPPVAGEEAQFNTRVEGAPLDFVLHDEVTAPAPPEAPAPPPPPPPQMAQAPRHGRFQNIFASTEDTAEQLARGKSRGDLEADIAGYTEMFMAADPTLTEQAAHKKAADFIVAEKMRTARAGQTRAVSGQTIDENGNPVMAFRVFDPGRQQFIDPASGQPDAHFRPVAAVGLGPYVEQAAIEAHIPRGSMIPSELMPGILARAHELQEQGSYATGMGTAQAKFDAPQTIAESQTTGTPVGTSSAQYAATQVQGPPTPKNRDEFKFYLRGRNALENIMRKDASGKTLEDRIADQNFARQLQGAGWAPNVMQTEDQRQYRQAQLAFSEARLRDDSGAVINSGEYANDQRTYFAVPGDSKETIRRKELARADILKGLALTSGPAYTEYYGEAFQPPLSTAPPAPPRQQMGQPQPQAQPQATGQPQAQATGQPQPTPTVQHPGLPPATYGKNGRGQTSIIFAPRP